MSPVVSLTSFRTVSPIPQVPPQNHTFCVAPSDLSWNPDSITYSSCDLGRSHLPPELNKLNPDTHPRVWGREEVWTVSSAQSCTQGAFRE